MAEVVRRGDTRNVQPAPTAAALAPPMIAAFMKFRRDGGLRGASADGDVASAGAAVSATGGFTSSAVDLAFSPSDPDSSDMDWFRTKRVSDVTLSLWDYIGDEITFVSNQAAYRNNRLVIARRPGKAAASPDQVAMRGPYLRSARSRKARISSRFSFGCSPVAATARIRRGLRSIATVVSPSSRRRSSSDPDAKDVRAKFMIAVSIPAMTSESTSGASSREVWASKSPFPSMT